MERHDISQKSRDRVFIKDLVLEMSAGIYDHEREKKQRVIVNIDLDVQSNEGKKSLLIDDVVSYETIVKNVSLLAHEKHYDLLEEFAELIALQCLRDERIVFISVGLEKPDIIPDTKSVGIRIERTRN